MSLAWEVTILTVALLYLTDLTESSVAEITTNSSPSRRAYCTETDYSPWSGWSSCSVTCGDGKQFRTRYCNDVSRSEIRSCKERMCDMTEESLEHIECSTAVDVSFLIDSSGSVGVDNFMKIKQFTKDVTTELKSGYERLNLTIITFNNEAKISVSMNESSTLDELHLAEEKLVYTHGGTETHKALQLLYNSLSRNDTTNPKVTIVITDGASFRPDLTKAAAQQLKDSGVLIFVVGVGDDYNPYELSAISSDPDEKYLFRLNNFDELSTLIGVFNHKKCPEITSSPEALKTTMTSLPTTTITLAPNETPEHSTGGTKAPLPVSALTPTAKPVPETTEIPTPRPNLATNGTRKTLAPLTESSVSSERFTTLRNQFTTAIEPVANTTSPVPLSTFSTNTEHSTIRTAAQKRTTETSTMTFSTNKPHILSQTPKHSSEQPTTEEITTRLQTTETQSHSTIRIGSKKATTESVTTKEETTVENTNKHTKQPITTENITNNYASEKSVTPLHFTAGNTGTSSTAITDFPSTKAVKTSNNRETTRLTGPDFSSTKLPNTSKTSLKSYETSSIKTHYSSDTTTEINLTSEPETTLPSNHVFNETSPLSVLETTNVARHTSIEPEQSTTEKNVTTTTSKLLQSTEQAEVQTSETFTVSPSSEEPTSKATSNKPTFDKVTLRVQTQTPTENNMLMTTSLELHTTELPTKKETLAITNRLVSTTALSETSAVQPNTSPSSRQPISADVVSAAREKTSTMPPTTATTVKLATSTNKASTTSFLSDRSTIEPVESTSARKPVSTKKSTETKITLTSTTVTDVIKSSTVTGQDTTTSLASKLLTSKFVKSTTALPPSQETMPPYTVTEEAKSSAETTDATITRIISKLSTVKLMKSTTARSAFPETTITMPPTTVTEEVKSETISSQSTSSTEPPTTTTASCIAKVADVVFVVDSSGSIGRPNFERIKEFIKDVILTFDVDYRYTRVGLIEFSTVPRIEFKLHEKTNLTDLLDAVDNITYSGGGTSTSDALELMRIEGFDRERPLAPDIAVIITDGLSKFPQLTRVQAQLAKQEGIAMFSIGIGNETSSAELQAIASNPSFVFEVGDYQTLFTLDSVVAHRACGVILPEEYHTRSSTPSTTTRKGCFDIDSSCPSYPRDSCSDYEPWARKNCPRKCGFCPGFPLVEPPCEDTIDNCIQYGTDMCSSTSQYDWVDAHCRKFCGFCGNKTDISTTTTTLTTTAMSTAATCYDLFPNCTKYGGPSMCKAYGDWAKVRCAKYCEYCYNYTTVPSITVNKIRCPNWKLPDVCTIEATDGQCCPMPKCPSNIILTVNRPVI